MLLNCGVGEDSWESSNEIKPISPEGNQSWMLIGRTDAEAETPILWPPDGKNWLTGKDPDAVKDWGQEEKGDNKGWDGWMASPTQWRWVWVNSGSWQRTGRPGTLWSMGLQRVRHDWATELNWTEYVTSQTYKSIFFYFVFLRLVFEFEDKILLKSLRKKKKNLHMYFTHIIDQP